MRIQQEQVEEFHRKYGYLRPATPRNLDFDQVDFRRRLMAEELSEYIAAAHRGDLTEIADALADLAYVVLGSAVSHGIDLEPIFAEVHRSNMTKDIDRDNINKPVKGEAFEPPRIAELLLGQTFRAEKSPGGFTIR
jgi:predicted HAD superfamily Cof-like phosphohydrolase